MFDPLGLSEKRGYWGEVGQVFVGYKNAVVNTGKGIYTVVRHPIQTVKGLAKAASNPIDTAKTIAADYSEKMKSSAGMGEVLGEALLGIATGGTLKGLDKAGDVSSLNKVNNKVEGVAGDSASLTQKTTQEAVENATDATEKLTQQQSRAVEKINNAVDDHLKDSDISGAVGDQMGSPIPKREGGFWNHDTEVNESISGIRKNIEKLMNTDSASAQAAVEKGSEAVRKVEEAVKGAGI